MVRGGVAAIKCNNPHFWALELKRPSRRNTLGVMTAQMPILVVDDDDEIREYLELALEGQVVGRASVAAVDCDLGIRVALVDLLLERGDSLALISQISATVPVIVMTGLALDAALVARARAAGAVDVLHKPFSLKKARALVAQHTL